MSDRVVCGPAELTDLAAGSAAEHIACADLLIMGVRAFIADQNCPYDVIADTGDRLVRVQVKSTRCARMSPTGANHKAYFFHCRRAGKHGRRQYGPREFDVLALVALDIRRVAYLPIVKSTPQCLCVRIPGRMYVPHPNARTFDSSTFESAISPLALPGVA